MAKLVLQINWDRISPVEQTAVHSIWHFFTVPAKAWSWVVDLKLFLKLSRFPFLAGASNLSRLYARFEPRSLEGELRPISDSSAFITTYLELHALVHRASHLQVPCYVFWQNNNLQEQNDNMRPKGAIFDRTNSSFVSNLLQLVSKLSSQLSASMTSLVAAEKLTALQVRTCGASRNLYWVWLVGSTGKNLKPTKGFNNVLQNNRFKILIKN